VLGELDGRAIPEGAIAPSDMGNGGKGGRGGSSMMETSLGSNLELERVSDLLERGCSMGA
jgi:hypothetical protein